MTFSPFYWFADLAGIVLYIFLFLKLREPESLRYLMLFLALMNALAIGLRNHPVAYWDVLWAGRAIGLCWWGYAAGRAIGAETWAILGQIAVNVGLFVWYEPFSSETTPRQMFIFLAFGFIVNLLSALAGIFLLRPVRRIAIAVTAFLALESAAVLSMATGYCVNIQLCASLAALSALAAISLPASSGGAHNLPPSALRVTLGS